ncbi:hypothetical protein QR680_017652 [Steinernema hermaphroditum]|uniref:Uncharacterized protein n=1 Tax=Steinernema hermaphroditum TaxID=289476 RepID=A0AA39HFC7_9BILA|nr:hypothetical protein QR680_017652 [Steinernema hermaphroditum]
MMNYESFPVALVAVVLTVQFSLLQCAEKYRAKRARVRQRVATPHPEVKPAEISKPCREEVKPSAPPKGVGNTSASKATDSRVAAPDFSEHAEEVTSMKLKFRPSTDEKRTRELARRTLASIRAKKESDERKKRERLLEKHRRENKDGGSSSDSESSDSQGADAVAPIPAFLPPKVTVASKNEAPSQRLSGSLKTASSKSTSARTTQNTGSRSMKERASLRDTEREAGLWDDVTQ